MKRTVTYLMGRSGFGWGVESEGLERRVRRGPVFCPFEGFAFLLFLGLREGLRDKAFWLSERRSSVNKASSSSTTSQIFRLRLFRVGPTASTPLSGTSCSDGCLI